MLWLNGVRAFLTKMKDMNNKRSSFVKAEKIILVLISLCISSPDRTSFRKNSDDFCFLLMISLKLQKPDQGESGGCLSIKWPFKKSLKTNAQLYRFAHHFHQNNAPHMAHGVLLIKCLFMKIFLRSWVWRK